MDDPFSFKPYTTLRSAALSPGMARAMGDVILAWMYAESEQQQALAALIGSDPYKASRLYQKLPNFRSRTQTLLMLIEVHPEFEPIKTHIMKLSSLSKTRNNWIHGLFLKEAAGSNLLFVDLDEPANSAKRSKPIKPADIVNHANAVRNCGDRLTADLAKLKPYRAWSRAQTRARKKAQAAQGNP